LASLRPRESNTEKRKRFNLKMFLIKLNSQSLNLKREIENDNLEVVSIIESKFIIVYQYCCFNVLQSVIRLYVVMLAVVAPFSGSARAEASKHVKIQKLEENTLKLFLSRLS
jgi:hypothetical protein